MTGINACVYPDAGVDAGADATDTAADDALDIFIRPEAANDSGTTDTSAPDAFDAPPACVPPRAVCAAICVDITTDPLNCGVCGRMCPAGPANSQPACAASVCAWECAGGFVMMGGMCAAIPAPRALTPSFGSTVTSRRPTFRWQLPTGATGARVDVCRDRLCTSLVGAPIDATGSFARPAADLPPGVLFWRLRSRTGAGVGGAPSVAWPIRAGARSAAVDTHWGEVLDIDGDGRADLAVTAQVSPGLGPVSLFRGEPAGIVSSTSAVNLFPADTSGPPLYFGYPCVPAGDVNGDGLPDVAAAAGGTRMNLGLVYLYHGTTTLTPSVASVTIDAMIPGASLGFDALAPGDFDADGYGDLAVGAITASMAEGRLVVYRGGPSGLVTPGDVLSPPAPLGADARYGTVALAGDVNGDGFADLVVSAAGTFATYAGNVFVLLGGAGAARFATSIQLRPPAGPRFGFRVTGAGDVNGDGYSDILVGAPDALSGAGRAWVFFGSAMGTSQMFDQELAPVALGLAFGYGLAGGGDVNGDGYSDVAVGEPAFSGSTGRVSVYLGGPGGLVTATPQRIVAPAGAMRRWGESVAIHGDLDGDGLSDLAVGGNDTTAASTGRIHVFRGVGPDAMTMSPGGVVETSPQVRNGGYEFGHRLSSGM